ncbi:MAG: multiple sugar transport system permease protein [Thermotogaceae bacterium]|jgi:multiple sugar transport system permease protein|nr:multiple sugar transport system permease protein [Thermotogaceae bacterium]
MKKGIYLKYLRTLFLYIALITLSIAFIMPFLWMVTTSLKSGEDEIFSYPPQLFPKKLNFDNYKRVLELFPWLTFLKNSAIITFLSTVGIVFSSSLAAFAFATLRFKARDKLFLLVISTMMIPYYTTLIPQYILFSKIGWIDTLKPLWVPAFFGSAYFIFLLRQFFKSIPRELFEAAKIDGCNTFQIFYKIYFPLAKPAIITVIILQFIAAWGDFFGPLIYLQSEEKYTLVLGLNAFRGMYYTSWHYLMAATCMVTIPSLIVFLIGQKRIIGGITITGMKS